MWVMRLNSEMGFGVFQANESRVVVLKINKKEYVQHKKDTRAAVSFC